MTDAQRFLRYVTPGITFGVATLLLLWILIPDWTSPELGAFFKKDTALASILATFFASGGLGYLPVKPTVEAFARAYAAASPEEQAALRAWMRDIVLPRK